MPLGGAAMPSWVGFAAWHDTPALLKMIRLADHIEWAANHDALAAVAGFLRGLREEDWHHIGD